MISTKVQAAPVTVSLSTSTARSSALTACRTYAVTCDVDCFILQGGSGVNATTSSVPLWSKSYMIIRTSDTSDTYIAGILSSSTGTLYIIPVID